MGKRPTLKLTLNLSMLLYIYIHMPSTLWMLLYKSRDVESSSNVKYLTKVATNLHIITRCFCWRNKRDSKWINKYISRFHITDTSYLVGGIYVHIWVIIGFKSYCKMHNNWSRLHMGCIKYMLAIGDFKTLSLNLRRELNNAATVNPKTKSQNMMMRMLSGDGMKRPWTRFY